MRKALAVSVVFLFLLMGLSSVYVGAVFNKLESADNEKFETAITNIEKITDRESLLDKYDVSKIPFEYPNHGLRKSTIIDGEEWDIVVPDDYLTIQEAIDDSINFEESEVRIYVKSGVYYENLKISVDGITLHGEKKEDTIINGNHKDTVVSIFTDNVNISGFSMINSCINGSGIEINYANKNTIYENVISDNDFGISILHNSLSNNIVGNRIISNYNHGIAIDELCSSNNLENNVVSDNGKSGLSINAVSRCNVVQLNDFSNNILGISIMNSSDGNILYNNVIVDNEVNGFDDSYNDWDWGHVGNYWSDYNGIDSDGDGFGDIPYDIAGGDNKDYYPKMSIFSKFSPNINCDYSSNHQFPRSVVFNNEPIIVPSDFSSIQQAIDNASEGDTIYVEPGEYIENIVIDKQIKLFGNSADTTIINGGVSEETVEGIDQFMDHKCRYGYGCRGTYSPAQSFVPDFPIISSLELSLWISGSPDSLKVSIREHLNSSDLAFKVINKSEIAFGSSHWYQIDIPDLIVTPKHEYFIFLEAFGADENNYFCWQYSKIDKYPKGNRWLTRLTTGETKRDMSIDFCFRTYGTGLKEVPTNNHVIKVIANSVEISGFTIKNSGPGFSGIRLQGDECNIHDNIISNAGGAIEVWPSENNIIENNYLERNLWGIFVYHSINCTILDNYFLDNMYGIQTGLSRDIAIVGNDISMNRLNGILIIKTNSMNIFNNEIFYNGLTGISVIASNNITFSNCHSVENGKAGLSIYNSIHMKIFNNNMSNNLNGLVLHYSSNNNSILDNFYFNNTYDGIKITNSKNNKLYNNTIFKQLKDDGITLILSDYNVLSNNIIDTNEDDGINLYKKCNNNIISNNSIFDCEDGILIYFSSNNSVFSNRIFNNSQSGIKLNNNSYKNEIVDNSIHENHYDGVTATLSSFNLIAENTIFNNSESGIDLYDNSDHNEIVDNSIYENYCDGVTATLSSFNLIAENTIYNNSDDGVLIYHSSNNNINENTIYNNSDDGIDIYDHSNFNNLYKNNVKMNKDEGIVLTTSCNNSIAENTIYNNSDDGVLIYHSSNNNINENTIYNNSDDGIDIYDNSSFNNVNDNTIYNNSDDGILIYHSSNNKINDNTIYNNSDDGIKLVDCIINIILSNVITHNGDDGIQIGGLSSSNTFIENNIDSNLEDGIDIISEGCSHNYFHHNNFINNTDNAKDDGNNIWNDTVLKEGNYWSDYDGIDNDGDDIGDSRYGVDSGNYDYYPLMNSWNGTLPPVKPYVHGPSQGKPNIEYIYTFYSVDPDDDNLYFLIDWGDYTDTDWIGPYDSGEIAEESHIWNAKGSYDIRVKAKDSAGKESEWSDPLIVTMPKNKHYINTPFLKFLEDHLHLFPLIRKLLDI